MGEHLRELRGELRQRAGGFDRLGGRDGLQARRFHDAIDRSGLAGVRFGELVHRSHHALDFDRVRVGAAEDALGAHLRVLHGASNAFERGRDHVDVLSALADHAARQPHLIRDLGGIRLDLVDQFGDLFRASTRAFRELANLVGHDRKPAPRLARARGLDRGIEGEQIRAARDARDDFGDLMDVLRLRFEIEDLADSFLDALEDGAHLLDRQTRHIDARVGLLAGLRGKPERFAGVVGIARDGGSHFVDQTIRIVEQVLLLLHTLHEIRDRRSDLARVPAHRLSGARDLRGGIRNPSRRTLHVNDQFAKAARHRLDALGQVVGFVGKYRLVGADHGYREIAFADPLGGFLKAAKVRAEFAAQVEPDRRTHAQRHEGRNPGDHAKPRGREQTRKTHHRRTDDDGPDHKFVRKCDSHALVSVDGLGFLMSGGPGEGPIDRQFPRIGPKSRKPRLGA